MSPSSVVGRHVPVCVDEVAAADEVAGVALADEVAGVALADEVAEVAEADEVAEVALADEVAVLALAFVALWPCRGDVSGTRGRHQGCLGLTWPCLWTRPSSPSLPRPVPPRGPA